ncbi:MAG: hypothetical protein M5U34_45865, partial [Chloroflexi bacterium]|nr:hypothetical protein [Chloroflexota bacterium]
THCHKILVTWTQDSVLRTPEWIGGRAGADVAGGGGEGNGRFYNRCRDLCRRHDLSNVLHPASKKSSATTRFAAL